MHSDTIMQWVRRRAGPPTKELGHPLELTSAEKLHAVLVVGHFKQLEVRLSWLWLW